MSFPSHRNLPYLEQNNGPVLGGKDTRGIAHHLGAVHPWGAVKGDDFGDHGNSPDVFAVITSLASMAAGGQYFPDMLAS
jgi:hypothetical protein